MSHLPTTVDDRWQPAPAVRSGGSLLGALLAGIAAFVALFRVGIPAAIDSLDGSWTAVLSWAFSRGLQSGSDIVFTYGPLGFLIPIANYHPQTYTLYFAAQVLLGVTWALLVTRFALRLPTAAQLALALLLLAWAPMIMVDVGWYLMFALAAVFVQEDARSRGAGAPFGLLVLFALSVIALTKFTFLLLWLAFVGHALLQLLLARRPRAAAAAAAIAMALLLGLWTAAGQHLASLPSFFRRGLEISGGYNSSMGYTPELSIDLAGLTVLAVTVACLAPLLLARGPDRGRRALGAFLLLTLALTWKAGYIRADGHVCIFLGAASLIAFLAVALRRAPAPERRLWQPAAVAAISLAGLLLTYILLGGFAPTARNNLNFVSFSLRNLFTPSRVRDAYQASWQMGARQVDLPASRERIGGAGVDLLMYEQGVVLLNDFNYTPRPAFQGYSTHTTALARLNEARLLSADGPQFLLFKLQAIDAYLPGNEDPLAQLAALRAYAPVGYEKGYVLLERSAAAAPLQPPPAEQWREAAFGEPFAVPAAATAQVLFYRVELSTLGKLYTAVFREPAISLQVTADDGSTRDYRVARSRGDAGSLVSPLLPDNAAYLSWYARKHEVHPTTLRFLARAPALASLFAPRVHYALQPVDLPRKDLAELPEAARRSFYPGFSHVPHAEKSPVPPQMIRNLGEDMLFMHAPSMVDFVLPPGRWRAQGRFGLRSQAYAPGVCPSSDGASLQVFLAGSDAQPAQALFSRHIDPLRVDTDRGNLPFEVPAFDSDGRTPIVFRFSGGETPQASTDCDWTVLGALQFVPADAAAH